MADKTLVIYNGRKDSSKKRPWNQLIEGSGYLAEDIDEKMYRVYIITENLVTEGYDFPKRFFYDIRQYIHLIPEKLFKKGVNRRNENNRCIAMIYGLKTLAIYNGRKNRSKKYNWGYLEKKGKVYPAEYGLFDDVKIYNCNNMLWRFPAEFFFDIRKYICQAPDEIFEAEIVRRETIETIAKYFHIDLPYDYEWGGVKFKKELLIIKEYLNSTINLTDGFITEVDTVIIDMARTTSKIIDSVIESTIDSPLNSRQIQCLTMLGEMYSVNEWIKHRMKVFIK